MIPRLRNSLWERVAWRLICLTGLGWSMAQAAQGTLDIREFGAKGDGTTKDTRAIQAAIDKASATGGTVVIPPGNYPSGTLHLVSNLTLRIEKGARLMFSPDDADFDAVRTIAVPKTGPVEKKLARPQTPNPSAAEMRRRNAPPAYDDTETSYAHYALLVGDGIHNTSIEGRGEIDGNRPKRGGPKPIAFKNSEWISIRGITIRDAPNYNISLMGTDHVEVEGVKLLNGYADGVDPDNCHFVRITNSYIDSWDDAVCPKASFALGKKRGTEHLVVANCVLRTNCNHFKFGTESEGDLKNVSVSNCVMLRQGYRAAADFRHRTGIGGWRQYRGRGDLKHFDRRCACADFHPPGQSRTEHGQDGARFTQEHFDSERNG